MSWDHSSKPLRDEEYPEPDDDDECYDTYPCPECGADVFEDAVQCPHCSAYISSPSNPLMSRTIIWIGLGLLGISTLLTLLLLA